MDSQERPLVESTKHAAGKFGGSSFGGRQPDGVGVHKPLPSGTAFPNGAKAALLLTFDVEGTYGNGIGDMQLEIANYRRMCARLKENNIPATFFVVGQMADEHGPEFIEWMLEANCEVAAHGYWHEMNAHYGGSKVYAGHYGPEENTEQIEKGIEAINNICPNTVRGIRMPYGHFNEFTYDAMERSQLAWASNVGIDDFLVPSQGFGGAPFQMKLGNKPYPIVEIPLDSQTYDRSTWLADEKTKGLFIEALKVYCKAKNIAFDRTPRAAAGIWKQRMDDAVEQNHVFTLLCHPINLTVKSDKWSDPVEEFLFVVMDYLSKLHHDSQAWVCTCSQLADLYRSTHDFSVSS